MQEQEDFMSGEVDLGDLSGQKSTQQILTKEAAAYTQAISSYGNGTYASWISRTWPV